MVDAVVSHSQLAHLHQSAPLHPLLQFVLHHVEDKATSLLLPTTQLRFSKHSLFFLIM
ncbi:unnamed protein product [Strongylus vulgaris]|uniref:Uncharacterized protein n=1 Tax=Strongylus vulgaris TaxID=40348 RepID=A0A3P7LSE1_STRVU|nr:unnamed protein product [Strongylus vulgaris]